jgi:hypothetical protein
MISYNEYNISADCTGAYTVKLVHFPVVRTVWAMDFGTVPHDSATSATISCTNNPSFAPTIFDGTTQTNEKTTATTKNVRRNKQTK